MTTNSEQEVLDFCRIKKIFKKGFGFLTSLYHTENVFFHFSKINDKEKLEALSSLKRGIVSVFFTSKVKNGKRKVDKVWLQINEVPDKYLNAFINRLILELNGGITNPFEIIEALNQLRKIDRLSKRDYNDILASTKIIKNPSILLKLFSNSEIENLKKLENFLGDFRSKNKTYDELKSNLSDLLNCKK